jgi:hypothetical protein
MQEDLYPREVIVSVLTDSSVNSFGDHTREMNLKFGTWPSVLKEYMNLPQGNQPHLEIGLNNQQSILHQLYNLVI